MVRVEFEFFVKDNVTLLHERIDKIEKILENKFGLISRIGILGNALHDLSEENHRLKQKPHRCPICDGLGKNLALIAQQVSVCNVCEGKGIIWG